LISCGSNRHCSAGRYGLTGLRRSSHLYGKSTIIGVLVRCREKGCIRRTITPVPCNLGNRVAGRRQYYAVDGDIAAGAVYRAHERKRCRTGWPTAKERGEPTHVTDRQMPGLPVKSRGRWSEWQCHSSLGYAKNFKVKPDLPNHHANAPFRVRYLILNDI
jgi:hypothetical protein